MISRKNRLKRSEVKQVLKKGQKIFSPVFSIKFVENREATNKFAVIVSKKVTPKAIKRNLLRRQIYEILRLNKDLSEKKYNIIIIGSPKILEMTYSEMEQNIKSLLKKIYE
ncbi:ribonuclease P protein component [Candidatus Peregrinibacteria bacterium]|nr:ribonuclease P protein component [Candidatus Peregrinibacteria bacterium]